MADRDFVPVTHFLCSRLLVVCDIMIERRDWSYGSQVIDELSGVLERLPFTEEEGTYVHRTLEPIVSKYGRINSQGHYENTWMKPLLEALKKVPGSATLRTPVT